MPSAADRLPGLGQDDRRSAALMPVIYTTDGRCRDVSGDPVRPPQPREALRASLHLSKRMPEGDTVWSGIGRSAMPGRRGFDTRGARLELLQDPDIRRR